MFLTLDISQFDEGLRVRPFASFLMELFRLVDDDLSVGRIDENLRALERARRRSFEVDSRLVIAAAMAGTLELVLRRQPVRRASEVRADRDQRVHDLLSPHDPDSKFVLPALIDLADRVVRDKTGLELLHRLEEHVREHESPEDAGQAAEGSGQQEPGGSDDNGKAASGHLPLFADVGGGASREGCFRYYLIWREFFRH